MKKFFKVLLIVVLITSFFGTIYFLYSKSKSQPDVYKTENPKIENITKKTVATGSVVPRKEIEIKPQVSGIIEEIYLEAGSEVEMGDIIAKVKIIPDMVTLNNAESRVNQAQLNYEDSKIDYNRQKELFDKKVIPHGEYQKAQLSFNAAREELSAAQNNLDLIRKGATKKTAHASNTLIRSTIDGMILDVPVEVGNSVIQSNTFNDGTTIAVIADMSDMIFDGKVDETEVGKIHEGMDIVLTIGAIENEKFEAKLTYLSPKGVEENGAIQFEIKANVNLKEGQFIRAGYSANANIVLEKKDSVMVIPEGFLNFENDSSFVEINTGTEEEPNFEKRFVHTGLSDGINIEITEGLSLQDKVKGEKIDPKKLKEKETNAG
ncbi:efflux RND transporter periplasmic adaptor subunit [uncultured Sunxiuqinia sp.]|uniref:efflux RND transporter periplasmic adaptor subunit n=1 Tax=uncultured Sunxiuqinia sp. TaxID=1573825 RepID=UPI002AA858CA|nr:efflux RND transporter periplasmic adaptor subunit [uncultured Sunxiuqinia sp.]